MMLNFLIKLTARQLTGNTLINSGAKLLHTQISYARSVTVIYPCSISVISDRFQNCFNIRRAHTDIKVPDWKDYRRSSVKSPSTYTRTSEAQRKTSTYVVVWLGLVGACYATKGHLLHYIFFMAASADVMALARIEINLGDIPEGTTSIIKWRGRPLFITHRTQESITRERETDLAILRDPQRDEDRVQRPEWLVVVGVCTHLGCTPSPGLGDFFGYYCPCHGAHYDGSGRTRKGPAPTNLAVPEYFFNGDILVVG